MGGEGGVTMNGKGVRRGGSGEGYGEGACVEGAEDVIMRDSGAVGELGDV